MLDKIKIPNNQNELLDLWIEGNEEAKKTVIFVHGFGVDKHETAGYFDDLTQALSDFRVIRFDFSGCGESEGRLEEKDYQKWSEDLETVIDYVKNNYKGNYYILAQSMGCFVTSLSNPSGIGKTIFTGIPNSNTKFIIERITRRFVSRKGAKVNYEGISVFPRSSGQIQKLGPSFWRVLKNFNPYEIIKEFSPKTKLLIIHPKQDDIVGSEYLEEYLTLPGVKIKWLNGDHSFTKKKDREKLISEIRKFFRDAP